MAVFKDNFSIVFFLIVSLKFSACKDLQKAQINSESGTSKVLPILVAASQIPKLPFVSQHCQIPKIVWMYYSKANIPEGLQPLYYHIVQRAQQSGYKVNLVNDKTVLQFISYKTDYLYLIQHEYYPRPQTRSDLIRSVLLYEHGGVWIDMSSILIQNFDWLGHLIEEGLGHQSQSSVADSKQSMKISSFLFNADLSGKQIPPQIFMFFNMEHQYNTASRLSNNKKYLRMPGYQTSFIAAKPKSKFLQDTLKRFNQIYMRPNQQHNRYLFLQDIYLDQFRAQDSYFRIFFSWHQVLQQKQRQLDRKLSIWNADQNVPYVEQYYDIWTMDINVGPFQLSRVNHRYAFTEATEYELMEALKGQDEEFSVHRFYYKQSHFANFSAQNIYLYAKQWRERQILRHKAMEQNKEFQLQKEQQCSLKAYILQGSIYEKYVMRNNPYFQSIAQQINKDKENSFLENQYPSVKVFTQKQLEQLSIKCNTSFKSSSDCAVSFLMNKYCFLAYKPIALTMYLLFTILFGILVNNLINLRLFIASAKKYNFLTVILFKTNYFKTFSYLWFQVIPVIFISQYFVSILGWKGKHMQTLYIWIGYILVRKVNQKWVEQLKTSKKSAIKNISGSIELQCNEGSNQQKINEMKALQQLRAFCDPIVFYGLAQITLELALNFQVSVALYTFCYGIALPLIIEDFNNFYLTKLSIIQKLKRILHQIRTKIVPIGIGFILILLALEAKMIHLMINGKYLMEWAFLITNWTVLWPHLLLYFFQSLYLFACSTDAFKRLIKEQKLSQFINIIDQKNLNQNIAKKIHKINEKETNSEQIDQSEFFYSKSKKYEVSFLQKLQQINVNSKIFVLQQINNAIFISALLFCYLLIMKSVQILYFPFIYKEPSSLLFNIAFFVIPWMRILYNRRVFKDKYVKPQQSASEIDSLDFADSVLKSTSQQNQQSQEHIQTDRRDRLNKIDVLSVGIILLLIWHLVPDLITKYWNNSNTFENATFSNYTQFPFTIGIHPLKSWSPFIMLIVICQIAISDLYQIFKPPTSYISVVDHDRPGSY